MTMKKKYVQSKLLTACMAGVLVASCFVGVLINDNYTIASADTASEEYNYTDSDYLIGNSGYMITDYPNLLIGSNAKIQCFDEKYQAINTDADDPIVQIIPKQYFYTVGSELVIGNEYGYYINTESYENDSFLSTAMVFDIETLSNLVETIDRVIVSVTPLFEYQYLCIKGLDSVIHIDNQLVDFSSTSFCVLPYARLNGNSITYNKTTNYYLKDISFAGSLYNEQYLNPGDADYDATKDYGSYFTALDYEYNGKYREYGEFPADQITTVITDYLGLALGGLETVFAGVPVVGNVFSALGNVLTASTTLADTIEMFEGIVNYAEGEIVQTDKKVTTQCFYQNRNDQLAHYSDAHGNPALTKIAAITCNTGTDESIWYGQDDYAKAYFTIGHGGGNGITPYFTRFINNIALKIVDAETEEVVEVGGGISATTLREVEYKSLSMDISNDIYMLPDGKDQFNFKVDYESDYNIVINLTDTADIFINGQKYRTSSLSISEYVKSGGITAVLSGNNVGLKGTIKVSPNISNKASQISSDGEYLFKVDLLGVKKLQTSNTNILIDSIYTIKKGVLFEYTNYGDIQPSQLITYPFISQEGEYYVLLHNNSTKDLSDIELTTNNVDELQIGETNSVELSSLNKNFFAIKSDVEAQYVISFNETLGTDFQFIFLNSELDYLNGNSYLNGIYIISMDPNKTYYIGLTTGQQEIAAEITVEQTKNSFQWKISGGKFGDAGVIFSERIKKIPRGYTYTLEFLINGNESNTALFSNNSMTSWGLYNISFNSNTNQVYVPLSCPIGGNGITIYAWESLEEDTSYNHALTLIPEFENKLNSVSLSNTNDIILTVNAPQYVNAIDYQIVILGKTSPTQNIEVAESSYSQSSSTVSVSILSLIKDTHNTSAATVTVKITKIHYIDALKNPQATTYTYSLTTNNLFASGNGTSSSPYQITHKRHFENISITNDKYYILNNNLSLGNWTNFFELKGTFDGNNKKITMTSYIDNYEGDIGLFSKNSGTIKNLTLMANISTTVSTTTWINVGGFAGVNEGTIDNCYMQSYIGTDNHSHTESDNMHVYVVDIYVGTVNTVRIGGITGYNKGIITNCRNYASIFGRGDIGGIAGKSEGNGSSTGYIYNSDNSGRIYYLWGSENRSIGGIVGYQESGTIDYCYNYGTISYDANRIESSEVKPWMGRIVGHKCGTVTRYNELGEVKTGELFKNSGFLGIGSYNQLEYAGDRAFGQDG